MLFLHTLALLFPFILPAFGQLTEVCNPGTGLCFNQAFDEATESTFGFALPTEGTFTDDFITTITTPAPYGFVGFGIGNAGEFSRQIGRLWSDDPFHHSWPHWNTPERDVHATVNPLNEWDPSRPRIIGRTYFHVETVIPERDIGHLYLPVPKLHLDGPAGR
ncbi:hypothetical protein B0H14DRAFT_804289 [Mycena olivaceomarginata]|nr:hypothetical protein B0H14DRAFT_804289 [Mycena olivaceomarginata]